MCLVIKSLDGKLKLKIAETDIVCYKLIMNLSSKYITPWQQVKIPKACIKGKDEFKAEGELCISDHSNHCDISGGVIHTFYDEYSALKERISHTHPELPFSNSHIFEIWECVIPKGTEYIEGTYRNTWGGTYCSYGSKSIRFVKKID